MTTRHDSSQLSPMAALFHRLAPRLMGAGKRLLGNNEDASDAMQDTFVKLWSKGGDITDALVITAMRNTCIDAIRRRREAVALEEASIPDGGTEDTASTELYDEVNRLIDQTLSERDREIMLMRDRDGYELDAIAEHTGLTEPNIRVILSRARRTVRQAYRDRNRASQPLSNTNKTDLK